MTFGKLNFQGTNLWLVILDQHSYRILSPVLSWGKKKTNHGIFWFICGRWRIKSAQTEMLKASPRNHYTYQNRSTY